jgi:hypothetical protein
MYPVYLSQVMLRTMFTDKLLQLRELDVWLLLMLNDI